MLLTVDPASPAPLYEQLAGSVRSAAAAGTLKPGERLPSAREVAQALEVNLHTVLKAYQQLRDEGLIEMRRGRGAVVADRAGALAALRDDARGLVERGRAAGVGAEALAALVRAAGSEPPAGPPPASR